MENFKVGDLIKSKLSGRYGIVEKTNISPNNWLVEVKFDGIDETIIIMKSNLEYGDPSMWEFIKHMRNRE